MLTKLKAFFKGLFQKAPITPTSENLYNWEKTKGMSQAQLDKRTEYRVGESYQVGNSRATVHADVYSMLRALAFVEHARVQKGIRLTERGIELMLMTPEEQRALKLEEWLEQRKKHTGLIGMIDKLFKFNFLTKGRYAEAPSIKEKEAEKEEVFVTSGDNK